MKLFRKLFGGSKSTDEWVASNDDYDEENEDYDDDSDDVPVGFRACGGDYPNCTTSCPLFDD